MTAGTVQVLFYPGGYSSKCFILFTQGKNIVSFFEHSVNLSVIPDLAIKALW